MSADLSGNVWIATDDNTIHRYTNGRHIAQRHLASSIRSLYVDGSGIVWVSTHSGLISIQENRFPDDDVLRYSNEHGLMGNIKILVLVDHENSLWIAQHG